jgi:hypothetical protein
LSNTLNGFYVNCNNLTGMVPALNFTKMAALVTVTGGGCSIGKYW